MTDFIYYGYTFKNFLAFKYPICEGIKENELKNIWNNTYKKI